MITRTELLAYLAPVNLTNVNHYTATLRRLASRVGFPYPIVIRHLSVPIITGRRMTFNSVDAWHYELNVLLRRLYTASNQRRLFTLAEMLDSLRPLDFSKETTTSDWWETLRMFLGCHEGYPLHHAYPKLEITGRRISMSCAERWASFISRHLTDISSNGSRD